MITIASISRLVWRFLVLHVHLQPKCCGQIACRAWQPLLSSVRGQQALHQIQVHIHRLQVITALFQCSPEGRLQLSRLLPGVQLVNT